MGPRSALAVTTAAAALLLSPVSPVPATAAPHPPRAPRCGDPGAGGFPLTAELHGDGAARLRAGGPRHSLTLRLRNTSERPCRGVHPVAVFDHEDGGRLRPGDIRLRYYDAAARRWRPVAFERTGAGESAGVFAEGFRGFALPAGGGREVPVRLGFGEDAPEGRVTVNVTAVQRRGNDGEWVGQSEDYEVGIGPGRSCCGGTAQPEEREPEEREREEREREEREERTGPAGPPERPAGPGPTPPRERAATPEPPRRGPAAPGVPAEPPGTGERGGPEAPAAPPAPGTPGEPGGRGTPPAPDDAPVPRWPDDVPQPPPLLPGTAPMPDALADTGPGRTAAAAAVAAASLLLGTALLRTAHHLRRNGPCRVRPAPPCR